MKLATFKHLLVRTICLVACALILIPSVMAAADDPTFTSHDLNSLINNTPFYDPSACDTSPNPDATSSNSTAVSTDSTGIFTINGPFKPKAYPKDAISTGDAYKGNASVYGNDPANLYTDPGDVDSSGKPLNPALAGATNAQPGIAVYNNGSLGGWWKVIAPNGKSAILQQTDVGPSTARIVDINTVASRTVFGYGGANGFPTDQGEWKIEYAGKTQPAGAIGKDGVAASGSSSPSATSSCCSSSSSPAGESAPVSGDLKSLAQQIIDNNKNIGYDAGPTRTQFTRLAAGQKAQTDDGRGVDVEPIILVTILHIAQSHKVNISALTDGSSHTAPTNPHGSGKAVDINILDGSHTSGTDSVADKITALAAEVLPNGARFGLGANGGVAYGSKQIGNKSFHTFHDNPNHVHIDVLNVSQADDDAAVQAAGGGGSTPTGDSGSAGCCPSSSDSSGASGAAFSGSVSPHVGNGASSKGQQNLQQAVVQAGQKFNVNPNYIAAFYYAENSRTGDSTNNADSASGSPVTGNGKWRDPAAPYGQGPAWDSANSYTALGPWQFITSTWQQYKPHGSNDTSDRLDLFKSAQAAGKYVAALGAKNGASEAALKQAAFGYNHSDTYAQSVVNTYKFLAGGGSVAVSGSGSTTSGSCGSAPSAGVSINGYKDPYRDLKQKNPLRIDMGLDYAGKGPVYALGNGIVNEVHAVNSGQTGWPGPGATRETRKGTGGWVSYTLKDGPAANLTVYVAENCQPTVKKDDPVTSDTKICDMDALTDSYSETGWAAGPSGTGAKAGPEWKDHDKPEYYTAYGENFSQLMAKLGEKPGTIQPGAQKLGSLPSNWPTW